MGHKRSSLSRSSYADGAAYARDFYAGGGPSLADLDSLPILGEHADILRAIWGSSTAEFEGAVIQEFEQEQRQRRHVFLKKWMVFSKKRKGP